MPIKDIFKLATLKAGLPPNSVSNVPVSFFLHVQKKIFVFNENVHSIHFVS